MKRIPSPENTAGLPRPRVAFFDLDGTVVNAAGEITPRVKESVRRLKAAGVTIAIASGRPWFGARDQVAELGATGASLFFSGALIADPLTGKSYVAEALAFHDAASVIEKCRSLGLYCEWYSIGEYFTEVDSPLGAIHAEYLGHPPHVRPFPTRDAASNGLVGGLVGEEILKVVLMVQGKEEEQRVHEIAAVLPHVGVGSARGAAHPEILFANFTSPRAKRDQAFEWLLAHYGVTAAEVISIGDAESDAPFLSRAGWSIAMGSAPLEVKECARFCTGTVADDGAAEALEAIVALIRR